MAETKDFLLTGLKTVNELKNINTIIKFRFRS